MKSNELSNEKIYKLILRLAIPSMLAQFVNVLYGIVDRMFVSQIPVVGDLALAGIGVTIPISSLITSFAFLVGLGGAPLMAIKMGEKNNKTAEKILFNCAFLLFLVAIILIAVILPSKDYFLYWFGASTKTFKFANQYLTIYIIGTIFVLPFVGLNSFITVQGYSKMSMLVVMNSAILNIILDYVFILKLNMGVYGAGLATVIAQFCSFIIVFVFLLSKKPEIRLKWQKLSKKIMLRVVKLGFSPFVIISTDSIIMIILNSVLQKTGGVGLGDKYVTASTIVISFMQLVTMPLGGITMGCQPIISYNYGAKNIDRVKKAVLGIGLVCVSFCVCMQMVSLFGATSFARIFTTNPDILKLATSWIKIYTAGIIFLGIQYATVDSFIAMSLPLVSTSLSLNRKLLIILLTIVLPLGMGAVGVMWAESIVDIVTSILSLTVYLIIINKILDKRKNAVIIADDY